MLRLPRIMFLFAIGLVLCAFWQIRHIPAFGIDALAYHLSLPAAWLQQGYLARVEAPFHDTVCAFGPMLSETIYYLMMRLTHDDSLVFLLQPACFMLLLAVYYRSVRLVGMGSGAAEGRGAALCFTAFLATIPIFFHDAQLANNDLLATLGMGMALWGLAGAGFAKHRRPATGSRASILLACAGCAVMIATRTLGCLFAAAVIPFISLAWLRDRRQAGWQCLAGGAAILIAGSVFQLRNLLEFGNPFYPAVIKLAGIEIFHGIFDFSPVARAGMNLGAVYEMLVNGKHDFSLTLPLSGFILSGWALSLGFWLRKLRSGKDRWQSLSHAFVPLYPLLAFSLFFFMVPFRQDNRLLFPVYYCFCLAAAAGWIMLAQLLLGLASSRQAEGIESKAKQGWEMAGMLVLLLPLLFMAYNLATLFRYGVLLVDTQAKEWIFDLSPLVVVAVLAAVIGWCGRAWKLAAQCWLPAAIGCSLCLAVSFHWWKPDFHTRKAQMRDSMYEGKLGGRVWRLLDSCARQEGGSTRQLRVAYTGLPLIYPLYGVTLDNYVAYVPISEKDVITPTAFAPEDKIGNIIWRMSLARRGKIDEAYWLAGLEKRNIELLWVADYGSLSGGARQELSVISKHPGLFTPIYHEGMEYLFLVKPGMGKAGK